MFHIIKKIKKKNLIQTIFLIYFFVIFQMAFSKPHRISSFDCFKTYKQAFNIAIPWDCILPPDIDEWLTTYCKGTNSNKRMAFSSLLTMTSCLCGPKTKVTNENSSFSQSFNTNILNVSDPGGGKTTTYNNFMQPGIDLFKEKTGKHLNLETYTHAGLQNQQIANRGYGLISSDEGHRFFSQLKSKISKGDNEIPLLCKMWSGKGDSCTLNSGNRQFEATSMSINLAIQPEPLLNDLNSFLGNIGFIERFLFVVAKPAIVRPQELSDNFDRLQAMPLNDVTSYFDAVMVGHKGGKTYKLSHEAQTIMDNYLESYANYLDKKYSNEPGIFFINQSLSHIHFYVIIIN